MTEPNQEPIPEARIGQDERSHAETAQPITDQSGSTGSDPGAIEGHAELAATESGAGPTLDATRRPVSPSERQAVAHAVVAEFPGLAPDPVRVSMSSTSRLMPSGVENVIASDISCTRATPDDTLSGARSPTQDPTITPNDPTNPTSSSPAVAGPSDAHVNQLVDLRDGRTVETTPHAAAQSRMPNRPPAAGRIPPDHQRCTANSKQTGERCKQWREPDRTVCRYHGGRARVGPANPAWKGAGYSRVLPMSIKDAYQRIHDDPDILSLRADAALMQLRLDSLVGRLGGGETGSQWLALKAAREQLRSAMMTGDNASFDDAIRRMCELIDRGASEEALWPEIEAAVESKSKVVMREWKRLVDLQQVMTAEQVMALIVAIMASVKRNVRSVDALKAIAADLQILLNASRRRGPVVDPGPRPAQA